MLLVLSATVPGANIPLLVDIHWLPVKRRIQYKIATISYSVIICTAPPYLSDLLELYTPSCTLRSSADNRLFCIPDKRNFKDSAPFLSSVPPSGTISLSLRHAQTSSFFSSHSSIIIIMYIYHALINALSARMIHINLNMIFYTHVEHSPT